MPSIFSHFSGQRTGLLYNQKSLIFDRSRRLIFRPVTRKFISEAEADRTIVGGGGGGGGGGCRVFGKIGGSIVAALCFFKCISPCFQNNSISNSLEESLSRKGFTIIRQVPLGLSLPIYFFNVKVSEIYIRSSLSAPVQT